MNYEPACYKVYNGNSNLNPDVKQIVTVTFNVNYYDKGKHNTNYFENNNVRFQTKNIDKTSNNINFSINIVKIMANKLKLIFDKVDTSIFDKGASYNFRADQYAFSVSFINDDVCLTGREPGQNKTVLSWHFSLTSGKAFSDLINLYIESHYNIQASACLAISNLMLSKTLTDLLKSKTSITEEAKNIIRENKNLVEQNVETISNMQSQFNKITKDSIAILNLSSLYVEVDRISVKIKELIKEYKESKGNILADIFVNKIIWCIGAFLKTVFGVTFVETYLNTVFKSNTYISLMAKNIKIFANESNFNNNMLFHIKIKDSQISISDEIINICLNLFDIYFTYKMENKIQEKTLFSLFIMPTLLPILMNVKDSDINANKDLKYGANTVKLKNLVLGLSLNPKAYELQLKKFYSQFPYLSGQNVEEYQPEVKKVNKNVGTKASNKQIKSKESEQVFGTDIFLGTPVNEKKINDIPKPKEGVYNVQKSNPIVSNVVESDNKKVDINAKMDNDIRSTSIDLTKKEESVSIDEYLLKLVNKHKVPSKIIECIKNKSNQYELEPEIANCAYELPIQIVVALLNREIKATNNKEYMCIIDSKVKELNDTKEKLLRDSLYTLFIF